MTIKNVGTTDIAKTASSTRLLIQNRRVNDDT